VWGFPPAAPAHAGSGGAVSVARLAAGVAARGRCGQLGGRVRSRLRPALCRVCSVAADTVAACVDDAKAAARGMAGVGWWPACGFSFSVVAGGMVQRRASDRARRQTWRAASRLHPFTIARRNASTPGERSKVAADVVRGVAASPVHHLPAEVSTPGEGSRAATDAEGRTSSGNSTDGGRLCRARAGRA